MSLNPCSDAILARVTAPGQLLAISHYSHTARGTSMAPETARRYRATGGGVEEVLALAPDMVVASAFLSPAARTAFADAGIRVETIGTARSIGDGFKQVRTLAAAAGDAAAGEALVAEMTGALEQFSAAGPAMSAVLWQPAGIVPGDGELISELMTRAGLSNHSARRGYAQADYLALEEVLADPPDILLIAGDERGQQHPALAALKDTHVVRLEPNLLFCGGPTIGRAMRRLASIRAGAAS